MTFREGLYRARGHIVFLAGLAISFAIIMSLDALTPSPGRGATAAWPDPTTAALIEAAGAAPVPQPTPLREDQTAWGRLAWRYFERNIDPGTGLAGSVDGFFSTTAWELGSQLNAMVAAERLDLLDRAAFDEAMAKVLASIGRLPLFEGALPNKSYDVRTLAMTDYNGRPSAAGIGWSALDIARLLVALEIVAEGYPEHAPAVMAIRQGWRLDRLFAGGVLMGRHEGEKELVQEGRIGYEEYAAKGLVLAGFDAYRALETSDTLRFVEIDGVPVPVDGRSREDYRADVCTTSDPYVLDGLEYGFDERSRAFAWAVFRAQERRAAATGIPTAVSEGHVEGAPFFVYGCVVANGVPWAVLSPAGERHDRLRFLDTKSVFGWAALFPTPYTDSLLARVFPLNDPERGWFTGLYERDNKPNGAITANTNAVVLESLHYTAFGPLLRGRHGVAP